MNRLTKRAATAVAMVAVAWVAVGGAASVASAHAEFQQSTVSAGATTTLTLDVPNERPAPRYTTTVRIQIAAGWSAVGCSQPAGWTCVVGGDEIAFQYADGPQQETFSFTLRAPNSEGTSTFPVVQIYDNAENVLWSDTAVVRVALAPSPAPSPPTSAPAPGPPTSTGPGPVLPTDVRTADSAAPGDSPTTSPAASPSDAAESSDGGGSTDGRTDDSDGGSPIVLVVLGAIVVLAIGAVIVFVRRRS